MIRLIGTVLLLFLGWSVNIFAETMSIEAQDELIARLEYLKGNGPRPASIDSVHFWCGTPYLVDARLRMDQMGRAQQAKAQAFMSRVTFLPELYGSPSGRFLIHYITTGSHAVRDAGVDVLDGGDGVPDYVNMVAIIADSVYHNEVDVMGYPDPPEDDFGGASNPDGRYDIYLWNLPLNIYGQTTPEFIITDRTMTSYMDLDNDYYGGVYADRPFDAVRVTTAHEFFHAVQLGMDYTEYEGGDQPTLPPDGLTSRVYWWEMSSVWMEEQLYDDINDYYSYLPYYYGNPWLSIQAFMGLQPYGAAIFPIYMSEKWGQDIVRTIWSLCALQIGANFLQAADQAIKEASVCDDSCYTSGQCDAHCYRCDDSCYTNGECDDSCYVPKSAYDLRRAFAEFTVWNWFTGDRYSRAPDSMRFSEGMNYPMIPREYKTLGPGGVIITVHPIVEHVAYDTLQVTQFDIPEYPQNLGSNYVLFNSIGALFKNLTINIYDDNDLLPANRQPPPYRGVQYTMSFITIPRDPRATAGVEMYLHPADTGVAYHIADYRDLQSVVFIPSPASIENDAYPSDISGQQGGYHYTYRILNTSLEYPSEVFAPYANLIVATHDNDRITFQARAETSPDTLKAKSGYLDIDLFTVAGEKIRHLESQTDYYEGIAVDWYIDNQSHRKVSPGVYLALVKLNFTDGSDPIVERLKVAVIK